MFGYNDNEIVQKNIRVLMPQYYEDESNQYTENTPKNRQSKVFGIGREIEGMHKDGNIFPIELAVSKININGKVLYTGILRDITGRKQAEQKLFESEQRYDIAVRGASVGLWDWNVVTNELYWSPRFKDLIGINDKEFVPHFSEFQGRLHPEDHDKIISALNDHLELGSPYDIEYRLLHNDGHYIWIHARGQAIWNEDNKAIRMAGSVDDISDKKMTEGAIIESRQFLELVMGKQS